MAAMAYGDYDLSRVLLFRKTDFAGVTTIAWIIG